MNRKPATVGELRAMLAAYPDESPVYVGNCKVVAPNRAESHRVEESGGARYNVDYAGRETFAYSIDRGDGLGWVEGNWLDDRPPVMAVVLRTD